MRSKQDKQRRRRHKRLMRRFQGERASLLKRIRFHQLQPASAVDIPVRWFDAVNDLQVQLLKEYCELVISGSYRRGTAYWKEPSPAGRIVELERFWLGYKETINLLAMQRAHNAVDFLRSHVRKLADDIATGIVDQILKTIPENTWNSSRPKGDDGLHRTC